MKAGQQDHSWVSQHFQVEKLLIDEKREEKKDKDGSSIFGVVYKLNPLSTPTAANANANAPSYVIALRGTLFTVKKDILQDGRIGIDTLHRSSRFQLAQKAVSDIVFAPPPAAADGNLDGRSYPSYSPSSSVWLAGHSLGASLATLVGKSIAKKGVFLTTFLFNPPFPSCPTGKIRPKRLEEKVSIFDSFAKAFFVANAAHSRTSDEEEKESLGNLSMWVPHLFLNPKDWICSEYIRHFEHRKTMQEIGAAQTEKVASLHSKKDWVMSVFRKDSDAFHLLPSANLIINGNESQGFPGDHELKQWWQPHLHLQLQRQKFLYDDLS